MLHAVRIIVCLNYILGHLQFFSGDLKDVIEHFLNGEDVNVENKYGDTPLFEAAFYGKPNTH